MNIFLWVLQGLLAAHTLMGAIWKFSHSAEQTMSTFKGWPQSLWWGLAIVEILCAIALVLPAIVKPLAFVAPYAAILIAVEMIAFCVVHQLAGTGVYSPMIYWGVVAVVCAFIAYGRLVLSPLA